MMSPPSSRMRASISRKRRRWRCSAAMSAPVSRTMRNSTLPASPSFMRRWRRSARQKSSVSLPASTAATASRNPCVTCRAYGITCNVPWRIPRSACSPIGMPPMCPPAMYDGANRAAAGSSTMMPNSAFVLAAGLGTRMRPHNGSVPKPLVAVAGKSLIDYSLDRLAEAHVERAVVNVHYLADALERHLASRQRPKIIISDERGTLMGTGGGIAKALPQLGDAPFFLVNSDTFWLDGVKPNFVRLADAFDAATMDALLLLAPVTDSVGYEGRGDFAMRPDGRLQRRGEREVVPFVYAGAAILAPALFADAPAGAFALTRLFDRAGEKGRLFGLRLDGVWMHVGTPDAVTAAEAGLAGAH